MGDHWGSAFSAAGGSGSDLCFFEQQTGEARNLFASEVRGRVQQRREYLAKPGGRYRDFRIGRRSFPERAFGGGNYTGDHLFFYLDHIFFSLSVNGEMEINHIPVSEDMERDLCGNLWYETTFETLNQGDLIEIHLYNPHRIGNQNAYREFLDSIYVGPPQVLTEYLLKEGEVSRGVGLYAMIIAILLLGVALAYSLMQLPDDERLWMMGLLTFLWEDLFS